MLSQEKIKIIYQYAQNIYDKKYRLVDAKKELEKEIDLKPNSFSICYYALKKMLEGKLHQRSINADLREYMLNQILQRYGKKRLKIALDSYMMHIDYYEKKNNVTLNKDRYLYSKYIEIVNDKNTNVIINSHQEEKELKYDYDDEMQQDELEPIIKCTDKNEIISELNSLKPEDSIYVTVKLKKYKRDNKTIAQLKYLRNYSCQICGKHILKEDGSYYIEAAHIKAKASGGPEMPDNILILCPNHHKEFDYGKRNILYQDKELIIIELNGQRYKISLKIE